MKDELVDRMSLYKDRKLAPEVTCFLLNIRNDIIITSVQISGKKTALGLTDKAYLLKQRGMVLFYCFKLIILNIK